MATTGNFSSAQILRDEESAVLKSFDNKVALQIGERAVALGLERSLPMAISIRIGDWEIFKASLPGSSIENDGWIQRKANVVNLTHHSTMYERVLAEETGSDWHLQHGVEDATHAIHGGGFPIITAGGGFQGVIVISGLPQVEDHLFALEILQSFSANRINQ
jgi:uncharacterized protein (UPF0303 family)